MRNLLEFAREIIAAACIADFLGFRFKRIFPILKNGQTTKSSKKHEQIAATGIQFPSRM